MATRIRRPPPTTTSNRTGTLPNGFFATVVDSVVGSIASAADSVRREVDQHFHRSNNQSQSQSPVHSAPTNRTTAATAQNSPTSAAPPAPPPASAATLRQLPTVVVRPEDLRDDPANRACCICSEAIVVNQTAVRLPSCAHMFHPHCILPWLQAYRCTCPVCRYELPTDDAAYEIGRRERMASRQPPRYASSRALHQLSIATLKELLSNHQDRLQYKQQQRCASSRIRNNNNYSLPSHIRDKTSLVDYVIASGAIDLIDNRNNNSKSIHNTIAFSRAQLQAMRIPDLRTLMQDQAGVFFDPLLVVEKSDLIEIFIQSGRLVLLLDDDDEDTHGRNYRGWPTEENDAGTNKKEMVETVDSDDEGEEVFGHIPTNNTNSNNYKNSSRVSSSSRFVASPRQHTDWVLEENLQYNSSSSNQQHQARSLASSLAAAAATTTPIFDWKSSSETEEMESLESLLSLTALRDRANQLQVDISDYVRQREELDRNVLKRLAEARGSRGSYS